MTEWWRISENETESERISDYHRCPVIQVYKQSSQFNVGSIEDLQSLDI